MTASDFDRRVVVVTGVAAGIGAAAARHAAAQGAAVLVCDIDPRGEQAAAEIAAGGGAAAYISADTGSETDWQRVADLAACRQERPRLAHPIWRDENGAFTAW